MLGVGEKMDVTNNIWDIQDNLILKQDGSVFAIYSVPQKVINSVDEEAKEKFKQLVYSVFMNLRKYHDFEINMIPIDQDLYHNFERLLLDIDWGTGVDDLAEYVLKNTISNLENSIGTLYDYKYYITVPLKSIHISMDLKSVIHQGYKTIRDKTLSLVGFKEDVPLNWSENYTIQKDILDTNLSMIDVKPLTRYENLFIQRLQYLRGQFYNKDLEVKMIENSIDNLDDINIEFENVNILKLTNFDQTSYVACLPVNTLPQNVSYLHLQEEIQNLGFPVESNFKVQFSLPKGAFSLLAKARRARKRLKNTMEEADDVDDVQKNSVIRSRFLLENIQEKFDEDEPMVSYLQTLIITGQSIEELKSNYETLYAHLNQLGVEVVRANADQVYLFYKNRMTELLTNEDRNFIQSMSLEAFCENLFFITRKVGTENGFYIGRVDNQVSSWLGDYKTAIEASSNPVYVNLLQANKQGVEGKTTNNPHTAIIGETGTGKSFLMKSLFIYHSFLKAKCLYIDPKGEMRKQFTKVLKKHEEANTFPELQTYIKSLNFLTLDPKKSENYGVLDPLVFLEGQEASDLADSMIDSLLGKDNNTLIQAGYLDSIDRLLTRRGNGEKVGMLHVFDDMEQSDVVDVRNAGNLLKRLVRNSILSLCFSDGSNEGISLNNKNTILEVVGLDLPKDNEKGELTKSQRKSLTVMYALGYFCQQFGKQNHAEETITYVDEVWSFNSTAIGRAILMEMRRVGRYFNNFMVFGTQSVHDLSTTEDSTGFGTVFAFLEKSEVDEVLRYLHVPVTERTREWISNMTMAQCIYFDTFGRRERMTVDGMFPEITELFDTVETQLQSV